MKFNRRVSKQPRKKRRAAFNAPLHQRRKALGVHVSKDLRAKLGARTVLLHKGDTVKVLRGSHAGKTGKVTAVDVRRGRAFVEGAVVRRGGGKETPVPLQPSNLLLTQTERKAAAAKTPAPAPAAPAKE